MVCDGINTSHSPLVDVNDYSSSILLYIKQLQSKKKFFVVREMVSCCNRLCCVWKWDSLSFHTCVWRHSCFSLISGYGSITRRCIITHPLMHFNCFIAIEQSFFSQSISFYKDTVSHLSRSGHTTTRFDRLRGVSVNNVRRRRRRQRRPTSDVFGNHSWRYKYRWCPYSTATCGVCSYNRERWSRWGDEKMSS